MLINEERELPSGLTRSKSATALKSGEHGVGEEDLSALSQLLSIAVAMLESNNDNEYLLALHLLDKVIVHFACGSVMSSLFREMLHSTGAV